MSHAAKQGENTSTIITTPAKQKRARTARQREEDKWAARSGPVTVSQRPTETEAGQNTSTDRLH